MDAGSGHDKVESVVKLHILRPRVDPFDILMRTSITFFCESQHGWGRVHRQNC